MKLPGKRKMIKIRQTIYEDPGNPFQDELDAERTARGEVDSPLNKPLPAEPDEVSPTGRSFFELDIDYDPFKSNVEGDKGEWRSRSLDKPLSIESSEPSPTTRSFRVDSEDDGSEYRSEGYHVSRTPKNSVAVPETQNSSESAPAEVRRAHHRSMSLAIPSFPPPDLDDYVSPRRLWRRENSLPLMKEEPEAERVAPKSARDTRFYGFYEDLMQDYDKRRSKL